MAMQHMAFEQLTVVEQYMDHAELILWRVVVCYFLLRDYIRNHKK
jgi:hypothetical protein